MRVGAARRLLGTTVRIGQQALDGAADVDRRAVRNRQRRRHAFAQEATELGITQLDRFAGGDAQALDHRLSRRWRLHLQREAAPDFHPRAVGLDLHLGEANGATRFDRKAQDPLLLILER
ncbi:hypothetical protein [Candidatus Accumulibacter necessarius]|uniref:hypothetical protein n=1 Tax=Candidatus Accumulibacter necessarius TaxID=2954386 RepID=UPI003DA964FB